MFEDMILMRVTTAVSVRSKMISFQNLSAKVATTKSIRSIHPHSPHHTPSRSISYTPYNNKQRNAVADAYEAPPQNATPWTKAATTRRIRSLRPHLPHDTLSRPLLHTTHQQQETKRNSCHVRSISLVVDFDTCFLGLHHSSDLP